LLALEGTEGPGIILFRGGSYSDREMLKLLDRVLLTVAEVELECSVTVAPCIQIHTLTERKPQE
jgi:hypothetical protein